VLKRTYSMVVINGGFCLDARVSDIQTRDAISSHVCVK